MSGNSIRNLLRMMYDQETVRTLYRKLLALYPRAFRERLGESMEQTFNDLCNERKQKTDQGLFSFVFLAFGETAREIIKEHILLITEGNTMKNFFTTLRSSLITSFSLVLPFMILELVNRRSFHEDFPIVLFGLLWLLPVAFIIVLTPIVRNARGAGNSILANPINLLLAVTILVVIALMWGGLLIDQLPCFLGVPNCD
jgi:hypothetical protein